MYLTYKYGSKKTFVGQVPVLHIITETEVKFHFDLKIANLKNIWGHKLSFYWQAKICQKPNKKGKLIRCREKNQDGP